MGTRASKSAGGRKANGALFVSSTPREKRPVGHPPIYSKALAAEVCRLIARGTSVVDVEKIDGMPCVDTIHGWVVDDTAGFFGDYMRARRIQQLSDLDLQRQIADESGLDVTVDDLGKVQVHGEVIKRAELRIKTRQWAMERVYEKVFGTKVKVEDVTPVPDEQLDRRIAELAVKAGGGLSPSLVAALTSKAKR